MDWSIFGNFDNIQFTSPNYSNDFGFVDSSTEGFPFCGADVETDEEAEENIRNTDGEESTLGNSERSTGMDLRGQGDKELMEQWEKAMASIGLEKSPIELRREDIVGRQWGALEDAEAFFKLYARLTGFSVRKGHVKKRPNGDLKQREWLCSKQGKREDKYFRNIERIREAKPITRVGCKVTFRVSHKFEIDAWVAIEFRSEHCHQLTDQSHVLFLRSNRHIEPGSLEMAKTMRSAGMRTCHIMSYMAEQAGGYMRMSHTIKDLYNRIGESESVDLSDADAAKAIGYLEHKCAHDVSFFGKYSYDQHFRLKNLVWADTRCQSDYALFGHAIAFDTTYKTNAYGKPLLVWIGINRHFRTTILGFALLVDETITTYKWVIEVFLECMKGVRPKTVVTDGDLAIRAAVLDVMPDTEHRLCGWHIHQNALANVKKPGFQAELQKLVYHYYPEWKFKEKWDNMVIKYKLHGDAWVGSMYEKRELWAETYLRGKFFAWMSTTQRNEGINSALKKKLRKSVKLYDLVKRLDMALSSFRFQEADDNFKTLNSSPVVGTTNMVEIEEQAARVYTRAMFYRVRAEIMKEGKYKVTSKYEISGKVLFRLQKFGQSGIKTRVLYDAGDDSYTCECQYYPSRGIPCRHIFACMKAVGVKKMPQSLIWKQWTMDSWSSLQDGQGYAPHCRYTCSEESARFAHLHTRATDLAYYASRSQSLFNRADAILNEACMELRFEWDRHRKPTGKDKNKVNEEQVLIRNPFITKCKWSSSRKLGQARGPRKCSQCRMTGHNKTTCNCFTTDVHEFTETPYSNSPNGDEEITFEEEEEISPEPISPDPDSTSSSNIFEVDGETSSDIHDFPYFGDY